MKIGKLLVIVYAILFSLPASADEEVTHVASIARKNVTLWNGDMLSARAGAYVFFEYPTYTKRTFDTGFNQQLLEKGENEAIEEYKRYLQHEKPNNRKIPFGYVYAIDLQGDQAKYVIFTTALGAPEGEEAEAIQMAVYSALVEAEEMRVKKLIIPAPEVEGVLSAEEVASAIFSGIHQFRKDHGKFGEMLIAIENQHDYQEFIDVAEHWRARGTKTVGGFSQKQVLEFAVKQLNMGEATDASQPTYLPLPFGGDWGIAKVEEGDQVFGGQGNPYIEKLGKREDRIVLAPNMIWPLAQGLGIHEHGQAVLSDVDIFANMGDVKAENVSEKLGKLFSQKDFKVRSEKLALLSRAGRARFWRLIQAGKAARIALMRVGK